MLARAGRAIGENDGKIRDLVLHMHEKRMLDIDARLQTAEDAGTRDGIERERVEYLMSCVGIVARFSESTENNERRALTIEYLEKAGDGIGARIVESQWVEEGEQLADDEDEDEDEENWAKKLTRPRIRPSNDLDICVKCNSSEMYEDRTTSLVVCGQCGNASGYTPLMTPAQMASSGMQINTKYSYNRVSASNETCLIFADRF